MAKDKESKKLNSFTGSDKKLYKSFTGVDAKDKYHLSERYGIKVNGGFRSDRYGGAPLREKQEGFRNLKNFDSLVASAAMNDYDTRRSMEAAAMAGNEDAERYAKKGFKNAQDVIGANALMQEMGGYEVGDLDFLKKSKRARITYNAVKDDRKQLATKDFLNKKLNELKDKSEETPTNESTEAPTFERSATLSAAEERLNNSAPSSEDTTLFNNKTAEPVEDDDAAKAAGSFLNQYKLDVSQGAGLSENRQLNLDNAVKTVSGR